MRSRFVEALGLRLHLLTEGSGRPALLLHGAGESVEDWLPVWQPLARERTLFALDLPGHGASAAPCPPFDPAHSTALLLDLLDRLGLECVDLVGSSAGGHKALSLALDHPERVASLTLVSSVGLGRGINPLFGTIVAPGLGELSIGWSRLPFAPLWRAGARSALLTTRPPCLPLAWWERQVLFAFKRGGLEGALAELRYYIAPDGRQRRVLLHRLPELRAPTLILWGARDAALPVTEAHAAYARLPGSRLRILPGAGHLPMLDSPERFAAELTDFWRTVADEPASAEPSGQRRQG